MNRHTALLRLAMGSLLAAALTQPAFARGFGGFHGGGGLEGRLGGEVGDGALRSRLGGAGIGQGELRQRLDGLPGGGLNGAGRLSQGRLSNFLGLPSDGGLHNLSGQTQNAGSRIYDTLRQADRPIENNISGETQSRGSQIYDQLRQGNHPFQNTISGETQSRGSQIYDQLRQDKQNFIPGETQSRGSQIYDQLRRDKQNFIPGQTQSFGSRAYDYLRAHPVQPISPRRNYNDAVVIRRNFNNYYLFTDPWYRRYPGAWNPAAWAYGSPWVYAPWPTLRVWMGYPNVVPVTYTYGSTVVYQNNSVYVNGQDAGTTAQYYQQAQNLAAADEQQPQASEQWMPLGVFALSQGEQTSSNLVIQLAVNRQGVIRGNYVDSVSGQSQLAKGSVDKQSQRVAWVIGDNTNTVFDTGLYNLTKDETNVMVHFGADRTEQWLMVRLDNKGHSQQSDD